MVGPDRRWKAYLAGLRAAAPEARRADVLAGVADAVGRQLGWRLPESLQPGGVDPVARAAVAEVEPPGPGADPGLPGRVLEAWARPEARQAAGAHYTPPDVAVRVAGVAADPARWADGPAVCDPACGGGAFLLAAAQALAAAGVPPERIVGELLWGIDQDELAVVATRLALALWVRSHGIVAEAVPHVVAGDGLGGAPFGPPGGFGVVVGNPPFLGQLSAATARSPRATEDLKRRFGTAVRPYTDPAWLFLLAGLRLAAPGGRVALIQPTSFLGARDARGVREAALTGADLVGLWVAAEPVFDANVRVCVPVLERQAHAGSAGRPARVARWRGRAFEPLRATAPPASPDGWAGLSLAALGVPEVELRGAGRIGDRARALAGFRDHFYGLAPFVVEAPGAGGPDDLAPHLAALVTAGLVDPGTCWWGTRPCRFAGTTWDRPAVDVARLRAAGGRVARWVGEQAAPKVVVAPQTRVGEAAVDLHGRWVASVPNVSLLAGADDVWLLAAVVNAPPIAAHALARAAGTALADGAIKLSVAQVLALPLPADREAWEEAAGRLAAGELDRFGTAMTAAYGLAPDHPVVDWWHGRRPRPTHRS